MDPDASTYVNVRSFGDVWECNLLDSSRRPPPRSSESECNDSAVPPTMYSQADLADKLSLANSNRAEITVFNFEAVFASLRERLVADMRVRQMLGDMAPASRGRGGLVARMIADDACRPVPVDKFFSREYLDGAWLSEAEILARFPDMHEHDPECCDWLKTYSIRDQFFIICVAYESGDGDKETFDGQAPYMLFAGRFGRYRPNSIYISEKHLKETGELRLSKDVEGQGGTDVQVQNYNVEVCSNKGDCPHMQAFVNKASVQHGLRSGAATEAEVRACPKLTYCGNCRIAKYCSRDCQKAHWPHHKELCRQANPKQQP